MSIIFATVWVLGAGYPYIAKDKKNKISSFTLCSKFCLKIFVLTSV